MVNFYYSLISNCILFLIFKDRLPPRVPSQNIIDYEIQFCELNTPTQIHKQKEILHLAHLFRELQVNKFQKLTDNSTDKSVPSNKITLHCNKFLFITLLFDFAFVLFAVAFLGFLPLKNLNIF